jgi:hypothetical protein
MDTIDEIGRRAARAALADAERYADVESGLARILGSDDLESTTVGPRRRWVVLAAAATVVAVGTAAIVWSQRDPSPPTVPSETPVPTTATSPPTRPASGLSVSYLDPPPVLAPHVFATVGDSGDTSLTDIAVTETGGAVTVDQITGEAIVVELDGTTRRVPLECRCGAVAAGPGDVLYAYGQGTADRPTLVAIPLSGDQAGQIVATQGLPRQRYSRLPDGAFGHGSEGLTDRRTGEEISDYVDTSGEQVTWLEAPPDYTIDENETVVACCFVETPEWPLEIERHPDYEEPRQGNSPPAPTTDGDAAYWTNLGPPDDPINVIAVLSPDGSAQWFRLPDGWSVAASDVWGTILTRRVGERVELATLATPSQTGPAATVAPTTLSPATVPPTTATPPTLAEPAPVVTLAEAIGANELVVREPGRITVYRDGAPTEAATPDGVYVQTDGTFLWWDIVTGETTNRSAAATLDATVVCEVDGSIHRIRVDPDGGYVASVERPNPAPDGSETPVPNFAVDCETGAEQPIETVSWTREGGSRYVEYVGERTFTFEADAEGNADGTNEDGISINGDDYAGYYEFSGDGSRVVYGDMDALASPHVTDVLRSRDTTTGELLWTSELDRPVTATYWYGDRIVALVPSDGVPGTTYEAVIVLDALTGDVVTTVPTSLDIAFVG